MKITPAPSSLQHCVPSTLQSEKGPRARRRFRDLHCCRFPAALVGFIAVGFYVLGAGNVARAENQAGIAGQGINVDTAHPGVSEAQSLSVDGEVQSPNELWANYLGYFNGPSIGNPTRYQPLPSGHSDPDRPVMLRNYTSLGYDFGDDYTVAGTAYWLFTGVPGQQAQIRDPYLRVSANRVIHSGGVNLYSDLRTQFGISPDSRSRDQIWAMQTFQILTYEVPETRFTLGANASLQYNFYGKLGSGDDVETYLAPNAAYQLSSTVAATLMYEMFSGHDYGDQSWGLTGEGNDLQPGVSWDITPNLNVNPYLNLFPSDVTMRSTSVGMIVLWKLI